MSPWICASLRLQRWAGIFKQYMGARNQVGIGLSYRPARLVHRLAKSIPRNRFLGSINVNKYGLCWRKVRMASRLYLYTSIIWGLIKRTKSPKLSAVRRKSGWKTSISLSQILVRPLLPPVKPNVLFCSVSWPFNPLKYFWPYTLGTSVILQIFWF